LSVIARGSMQEGVNHAIDKSVIAGGGMMRPQTSNA
jgi:hypothetical protein